MRILAFLILPLVLASLQHAFAQGNAFADARLPADSVEVKPHDPPATASPWQLPKAGDRLYDAEKEGQIKKENEAAARGRSHLVHVFERGVFIGYETISVETPPKSPAKAHDSPFFTQNPKLPPDAVELAAGEHPDKSNFFQTRPDTPPPELPLGLVLVRVFQGKTFVGWDHRLCFTEARHHARYFAANESLNCGPAESISR